MTAKHRFTLTFNDDNTIECVPDNDADSKLAESVASILSAIHRGYVEHGFDHVTAHMMAIVCGPTKPQVSNVIPFPNRNKPDNDAG